MTEWMNESVTDWLNRWALPVVMPWIRRDRSLTRNNILRPEVRFSEDRKPAHHLDARILAKIRGEVFANPPPA